MYTPDYSDTTVGFITVTLEMGWFFYDHIISVSTLHRVMIFFNSSPNAKKAFMAMTGFSIVFGAVFRILRNTCRFGTCAVADTGTCDSIIASNVLICQFILLGALLYKCTMYQKQTKQSEEFFGVFVNECYIRLIVSVPLGLMEAAAYVLERVDGAPTSFVWFLANGIFARQLAPTMLAMAILSTKVVQQAKSNQLNASHAHTNKSAIRQ
jgi:hypothetical protein